MERQKITFRKCKLGNSCFNHCPQIMHISSFSWIYNPLIKIKLKSIALLIPFAPKCSLERLGNKILGTFCFKASSGLYQKQEFSFFYVAISHNFLPVTITVGPHSAIYSEWVDHKAPLKLNEINVALHESNRSLCVRSWQPFIKSRPK